MRSLFLAISILISQGSIADHQIGDSGCFNTTSSDVECYHCYQTSNASITAECERTYKCASGGMGDAYYHCLTLVASCKEQKGFREQNVVENICKSKSSQQGDFGQKTTGYTDKSVASAAKPGPTAGSAVQPSPSKPSGSKQSPVSTTDKTNSQTDPQNVQDQMSPQDNSAANAQCEQSTTIASSCCRNPDGCLNSQEQDQVKSLLGQLQVSQGGSGLNGLAQSSSSLNDAGANINAIYSTACYRSKTNCTQACQNSTSSAKGACSNLSAAIYSEQSVANAGGSGMSDVGNMATQAATPNSDSANDPYGCQKNPSGAACQQCTRAPNTPACQAMAAKASMQQLASERGSADFKNASTTDKNNNFNLGGATDLSNAGFNGAAGGASSDNVPQVKPIANNSGGGIPGGEGGSGQGAKLNGGRQTAGGSSPGSPGISTDIDQGLRSGGGYTAAAGGAEMPDASGRFGGGHAAGGRNPAGARIDLKQYLPGGRLDPRLQGGMQNSALGIHGPHVDIWSCIHDRMIEKCRLGELYDCGL